MKCSFILLLLVIVSCSYSTSQSKNNITITVDVDKVPELGFVVSWLRSDLKSIDFDANGHGECAIEDMDAAYLILYNGFAEKKMIYAEKGDHIRLAYDGVSMQKSLKMTDARQPITEYLEKVNFKWPDDKDFALEIDAFVAKLHEKVNENRKLVDSLEQGLREASDKFVKIERMRIKFMMGLSLLDYARAHAWHDNSYKPGEEYYRALESWMEEDKDFLCLSEYRTFMTEAPAFIMSYRETIRTPYEKVLRQMEYIQANYKDKGVREGLLSIVASDYIKTNGIEESKELDAFVRRHVTEKDALRAYQKIYNSWDVVAPGRPAPDFKAIDTAGKEYSLKDFKGKYVCLYFWVNLMPSTNEFKHLAELQALFEEKNVVLVNLSIDNDREKWQQALQNEEVQRGTHLFLGRDKGVLQKYHFISNNMYLFSLIDPEGKVVKLHAPRASSGQMQDFLRSVIHN